VPRTPLTAKEQVERIGKKLDLHGFSKKDQKAAGRDGFRGDRTLASRLGDLRRAVEYSFEHESVNRIKDITPDMFQLFIDRQKQKGKSSGTLRNYSRAIQAAYTYLHGEQISFDGLEPRSSDAPTDNRAFTCEQVFEIINHQRFEFAMMTEIAFSAGLRATELTTIRSASEYPGVVTDKSRQENLERHEGNRWLGRYQDEDVSYYTVTGKGGLEREVAITQTLAYQLEIFRLSESRKITAARGEDTRVFSQYYDIPSGEVWARNFSKTSKLLFGDSRKDHGPHGMRHTFAKIRIKELQRLEFSWNDAREIISQEMGHFRPSETDTYLR